ncbi:MAG: prepilin peptidase [Proteobacteria bacterium]|nr:prepilin peptidase [Pseudomonadota bacterium]
MPLLALLHIACLASVAALLVGAGAQDLRSMQIANGFSLAIAGLFIVWAATGLAGGQMSLGDLALSLGCGVAVFGVGAAAFAIGALGGGDVKLLAAVSLFAGPERLPDFLIVTAVAGGLLGLAILAGAPIGRPAMAGAGPLRARLRGGLPYGPAIAVGGLWLAASLGLG